MNPSSAQGLVCFPVQGPVRRPCVTVGTLPAGPPAAVRAALRRTGPSGCGEPSGCVHKALQALVGGIGRIDGLRVPRDRLPPDGIGRLHPGADSPERIGPSE